MSERLDNRAEIIKLARLLAIESTELDFLAGLPSRALREYRREATERLFEADAALFRRVGAAAKLIPSGLIASIAQRAFGPLLCARAAGTVDTSKALDVLRRLPPEFVADATIEVDPRRVVDLIASVSQETVVPVARILGERREYVTMGRFLAYVPDHTIVSAIGALSDEALLRTAFVLEHKDRLDHAVGLLPADRLPGVIAHASTLGLWPEALDLLDQLSDERRAPIAEVVAEQEITVIADLVAAVSTAEIWDSLLPIVRLMSEQSLKRLVTVPAFHDPETLARIIDAAARQGLWRDLAVLIHALPPDVHAIVTGIASKIDAELLANVVRDAVAAPEALPPLMSIVDEMDPAATEKVAVVIDSVVSEDPSIISEVLNAAADRGTWRELAPLLDLLSEDSRATLAVIAGQLSTDRLTRIVGDAVAAPEALPGLIAIIAAMDEPGQQMVAGVITASPEPLARNLLTRLSSAEQEELMSQLPPIVHAAVSRVRAQYEFT